MLESTDYPAIYRCAWHTQLLNYGVAFAPMAAAVGVLYPLLMGQMHGAAAIFFLGILGLGMLAASGAFVLAAATYTLTLDVDTVSWGSVFARRSMQRRNIKGYRRMPTTRGLCMLMFLPTTPDVSPLRLIGVTPDARFERWLHGLPDLGKPDSANG